jgi:hypothetical protein
MNDLIQAIYEYINQILTNQTKDNPHIKQTIITAGRPQPSYIHYVLTNQTQKINTRIRFPTNEISINTCYEQKDLTWQGEHKEGHQTSKTIPDITLTLNEPNTLNQIATITKENIEIIQNPTTLLAIILGPHIVGKQHYEKQISHLTETSKALKQEPYATENRAISTDPATLLKLNPQAPSR